MNNTASELNQTTGCGGGEDGLLVRRGIVGKRCFYKQVGGNFKKRH